MVGYSSHGYCLYDRTNRLIVTSRNVIFEEGLGHRTLTLSDKDDLESSTPVATNPAAPAIPSPRQQIAPQIRSTDGPLHGTLSPDAGAADQRSPAPTITPVLQRSTRTTRPTRAMVDARESLATQSAAREAGEEWAEGEGAPEALLTSAMAFAFLMSTRARDSEAPPRSYWEAMRQPGLWIPAMDAELKIMEEKGVWEVIDSQDVPAGKKVVDCMWVYANKYNAEGEIVKRKARLVAKGYTQVQGEDFDETYASVVRLESMRMTVAIAAALGMHIWQVDFVSAYLNSKLEHTVYMKPPPGF